MSEKTAENLGGAVEFKQGLLEDYALKPVPAQQRKSLYANLTTWSGWVISISAFLVGGQVGKGLSVGRGFAAIILGNLFLALVAGFIGNIGARTGLSTTVAARMVFGKKGSVLISLLLGIIAMLFIGVLLGGFGQVMTALFPWLPAWAAILVFTVLCTSSAIFGYRGLALLSMFAVPALWVLAIIAVLRGSAQVGGLAAVMDIVPKEQMSFWLATTLAIGTWITGASLSCDVARYCKSSRDVFLSSVISFIFGAGLFESASLIVSLATGSGDLGIVFAKLGMLTFAVLTIGLALWTTTDNNIYSSALAFTNLGNLIGFQFPKWGWTLIAAGIALVGAAFNLVNVFRPWLVFLTVTMTPFAGVMLGHYYLTGFINKPYQEMLHHTSAGFRWIAFAAWVVGILVVKYYTKGLPAVQGMIASAVVYWILFQLFEPKAIGESPAAKEAG